MYGSEAGQWLEKALIQLCSQVENGLSLDYDVISGVVSYCELAPPEDAREYLNNIISQETVRPVVEEYMQRRGYGNFSSGTGDILKSNLQTYIKPPADADLIVGTKKLTKIPKDDISKQEGRKDAKAIVTHSTHKSISSVSKKKKSGKVVSLADAAKGSIVFQQGKPCSCQACRHKLVSNCLSCGKIVCEQEGEGPCSFCGALVLREGSTYAGLDDTVVSLSESEAAAEAFKKRLVDYDRNSAARTTVIDDQSDYYEIEGNSWLSAEEKMLLQKKQQEVEDAERERQSKVVVTFDLVGRKVLMHKDAAEMETENGILRPTEPAEEREINRIKPNPSIGVHPVFVDPTPKGIGRIKQAVRRANGLCLEMSGRVQHDIIELPVFSADNSELQSSQNSSWQSPKVSYRVTEDFGECS